VVGDKVGGDMKLESSVTDLALRGLTAKGRARCPRSSASYLALLGAFGLLSSIPASATTINLSTGTAAYTITSDTTGEGTSPVDVSDLAGGWIPDGLSNGTSTGVWIAPEADQADKGSSFSGTTTYQVTFNLTGDNPLTAALVMNLAGDDYVSVTLNGFTVFNPTSGEITNGMWTAASGTFNFNTAADFNAGLNTLTFVVPDQRGDGTSSCCGPTGLIVAADVTASSVAPEPATFLPMILMIGAGALVLRRGIRRTA
jgi:hypothetical protein